MIDPNEPPKFIFLSGPSGVGKSSVAQVFLKAYHGSIIYHTHDVLVDALMHTIYGEPTFEEYTQDWKDNTLPVRYTSSLPCAIRTNRDWLNAYQKFLRSIHGEHILGELAARQIKHFGYINSRVVIIDSLRTNIEKSEFMSHFPRTTEQVVRVHREGGYDTFSVGEWLEGERLINVRYEPIRKAIIPSF